MGAYGKGGQAWRRVKPHLLRFLVVLMVAGAIWALIFVPKMQVPVCPPGQDGLPPKICFDIENEARKTLAYILGGLLAIIGIYMAHRRIRALERQVLVAQEGQITERFTRAIEQLGSDRMEVRLGGIYALERIANDSDKDHWPIMETLTAYVRERAQWREQSQDANGEESGEAPAVPDGPALPWQERTKPATDIQAILTVLGRRKYRYGHKEDKRGLDLRNTDLRGANLAFAHLEFAWLWEARLEGAWLMGAYLEGASLWQAHLERADLLEAHLEGAALGEAHLEWTSLLEAHLEGAWLQGAHLEGASLSRAHLKGANLWGATGLTREQLARAIMDENTRLPDYLQENPPEDKEPKGEREE